MTEALIRWDPVEYLSTQEEVRHYFKAALEEDSGDGKLVKKVLSNIARALSEKQIQHDFGMSGNEIREALSDDPDLSLSTLSCIAAALGMKLTAATAEAPLKEICYRAVTKEEAQAEILELLATEPNLCLDDISDRLRIEMEMVVDIYFELEDTGTIKLDD